LISFISISMQKTSLELNKSKNVIGLKCRDCGKLFDLILSHACDECLGALDVVYDYERIEINKEIIAGREKNMWRYRELLPFEPIEEIFNFGAGFTPLIKAKKLGEKIGIRELYIKNDSVNPTYSFKDRPAAVGVNAAINFGLKIVGCASTGNLASATAAYAARVGLECLIFIPANIEKAKVIQALSYGAKLVLVDGTYDDVNRLVSQAADLYNIGIVNVNLRPFYVEGSKTLAFEVAEQLNWEAPDAFIVPTASGAMFNSICRGFEELRDLGLVNEIPSKPIVAQAKGCNPITKAFKNNSDIIEAIENPKTIAHSLAIGNPGDGIYVLRRLKKKGLAEDASDEEIIEGIKLLAKYEGIFTEPAGGVAIAVLKKLVEEGKIDKDERVVCYITGNGLKAPDAIKDELKTPFFIKPTLKDLERVIYG